jgi:hypothetical protein
MVYGLWFMVYGVCVHGAGFRVFTVPGVGVSGVGFSVQG